MPFDGVFWEAEYLHCEAGFLLDQGKSAELETLAILNSAKARIEMDTSLGTQAVEGTFLARVNALTAVSTILCAPDQWFDLYDQLKISCLPQWVAEITSVRGQLSADNAAYSSTDCIQELYDSVVPHRQSHNVFPNCLVKEERVF